jgi:hypothetical protein
MWVRKIIFIIILLIAGKVNAQLSTNQKTQTVSMIKASTDPIWKAIGVMQSTITADSIRINKLEIRVKALEDSARKYNGIILFDTATSFKIINGNLLQLKKLQ